ncbi:hypothetical protein FNW25_14930 [Flavobacterium franklandianum]|uniref:Uncharacterized protein n=1 Tax=Flavobacterium franklandianum TaxID=2594430 RepID=A0A553C826_9FLAO|nr:hypothetical protein [Flavobacterium franklandianum]TRX16645.1 hypothetical protein FNW17_12855 [Flavobacterium franklandianum]TRX22358.1 hypothetical protein FNW25_14930 [Flavobacterium franklandianum]
MKKLIERTNISENSKDSNAYEQLGKLLNSIEIKELPDETVDLINNEIEQINSISDIDKYFVKAIKEKENGVIKLIEKKHKIAPKNYYRKLWMILGMSIFGIPMGVAFGLSIGNLGMLGIGLPIGMAIGIGVGSSMDKKAFNEGRQLDFEVK